MTMMMMMMMTVSSSYRHSRIGRNPDSEYDVVKRDLRLRTDDAPAHLGRSLPYFPGPRRCSETLAQHARRGQGERSAWLSILLTGAFLLLAQAAQAADYYACDCDSGADPTCVAGNDQAAGTSPANPWRSYDRAQNAWAGLQPGDSIRMCRGGVFPIAGSTQWVNTRYTAAQRCTLGSYLPPGAPQSAPRPHLTRINGTGIGLDNGGMGRHEEGVVIEDLQLSCSACTDNSAGIFLYNDIDDVLLQRLLVRGFGDGIVMTWSQCQAGAPNCNGFNERVSLIDSEIRDNNRQGWFGAADDLLIEGNRFIGNGRDTILDHNIYIGGNGANVRVIRNELYRAARTGSGRCNGASLVAHGVLSGLLIEGNYIHEDLGAATGACWGINLSPAYDAAERFENVIVRGNNIVNVGNVAIALTSCVNCLVENNLIVQEQPFFSTAVAAPALSRASNDAMQDAITVRNNSIYSSNSGLGIRLGGEGSQHRIVSNAIHAATASQQFACLELNLPVASYATVDHNVCGYMPGTGRQWATGRGSLANWRALTGFDLAGLDQFPGFGSTTAPLYDLRAASGSAPMVGRGHPTLSAPLDFQSRPRGALPDAGAYQRATDLLKDGFERP